MYVLVEILQGRGCLANLGSHASDQIVVRVGEPESWAGVRGMPSTTIEAPIMATPSGIEIPQKLTNKIKHQITKRAFQRNTDKYQLRLYVLRHDGQEAKWLGIVAFRLLSLTAGYVVERWVPMQLATKIEPGALRVRVVIKETAQDALAVLRTFSSSGASHTIAIEGCCCDVCDPHFQSAKPTIDYFDFEEKHSISAKAGRVIAKALIGA